MEPQLEGCGKRIVLTGTLKIDPASMEPQLEGCGKLPALLLQQRILLASMEPQLEGCGKMQKEYGVEFQVELQWSRNLRVAERFFGFCR